MDWIKFDFDKEDTLPDEGIYVLATDGYMCAVLWYLWGSAYEWQPMLEGYVLPFTPTHWMPLPELPNQSKGTITNGCKS